MSWSIRAALAVCICVIHLLGFVSAQAKYWLMANGTCGNAYFDTTSYECLPCGITGAVSIGPICACPSGFVVTSSGAASSCSACAAGTSNSFTNPARCLPCSVDLAHVDSIYNNATYDPVAKTCICPEGMYLTERTRFANQSLAHSFSCVSCPDNHATAPDKRSCVLCKDPRMRRSAAGLCSCLAGGFVDDGSGNCVTQTALTAVSAKYSPTLNNKTEFEYET